MPAPNLDVLRVRFLQVVILIQVDEQRLLHAMHPNPYRIFLCRHRYNAWVLGVVHDMHQVRST